MPYEKNRKRDSDTERRIYYADDALTSYTRIMESVVRRSCGARSAIEVLACRNDLNRKRIVSLQLTAHS